MPHLKLTLILVLALLASARGCDDGDSKLDHINPPPYEVIGVSVDGPGKITNGRTGNYTATVNIKRRSDFKEAVKVPVTISGAGVSLGTKDVDIPAVSEGTEGSQGSVDFALNCNEGGSPPGTVGNIHSESGTNTRQGSRKCTSSPAVPCTLPLGCGPPAPCSGCGGAFQPPCHPGCGSPFTPCSGPSGCGSAVVACVDDPLVLTATAQGLTSRGVSLLCIPSVGPTQGTF